MALPGGGNVLTFIDQLCDLIYTGEGISKADVLIMNRRCGRVAGAPSRRRCARRATARPSSTSIASAAAKLDRCQTAQAPFVVVASLDQAAFRPPG